MAYNGQVVVWPVNKNYAMENCYRAESSTSFGLRCLLIFSHLNTSLSHISSIEPHDQRKTERPTHCQALRTTFATD
jgi:hypothetical protein